MCEDVAALADADAALVRDVGVPDGSFGVDADAVGHSVAELGPDTTVGQAAVVGDLVGGQPLGVGLADDQGLVVAGHRHAVGEGEPIGDLPGRPVRCDQHHAARRVRLAGHQVEAAAVHVGVAAAVDDELVAGRRVRALTEIGVHLERAVGLVAQQSSRARIDDEHSSVRQPVDTERERGAAVHDLGACRLGRRR